MEGKLKPFIKKLLKRDCITVSYEATIKEVAALLAKKSIGAVPVTNENEEVVFLDKKIDDKIFLDYCLNKGLTTLKGHRSVGGFRASIYNAMPEDGVDALIEAMQNFEKNY